MANIDLEAPLDRPLGPPAVLIDDEHKTLRREVRTAMASCWPQALIRPDSFDARLGVVESRPATDSPVVVDLDLPLMRDPAALARFVSTTLPRPVIGLAAAPGANTVAQAFAAGLKAVARKSAPAQVLVEIVRLVVAGERYAPVDLLLDMMGTPAQVPSPAASRWGAGLATLSQRERTVLIALAAGRTNKEIARKLDIREITVKSHMKSIFKKLGIRNRIMAAKIAMESGLAVG